MKKVMLILLLTPIFSYSGDVNVIDNSKNDAIGEFITIIESNEKDSKTLEKSDEISSTINKDTSQKSSTPLETLSNPVVKESKSNLEEEVTTKNWDQESKSIVGMKFNDFNSEFNKLQHIKALKKDEYESDETYSKRLSDLKLNKPIKFYAKLSEKSRSHSLGQINYDANNKWLTIKMENGLAKYLSNKELTGDFIIVKTNTEKTGSYIGTNAYGVSKRVTNRQVNNSVVVITSDKSLGGLLKYDTCGGTFGCSDYTDVGKYVEESLPIRLEDVSYPLEINLEIRNSLAGQIKDRYGIVFVGVLDKPYFGGSVSEVMSAEIDFPTEVRTTYKYLQISLDEIWLVSDKSKDILVKFKVDGNEINPKYQGDISLSAPRKHFKQ